MSPTPEPMSSEFACLADQSLSFSGLKRKPRHRDLDALVAALFVIAVEDEGDAVLLAAHHSFEVACDPRHGLSPLLRGGGPANMIR